MVVTNYVIDEEFVEKLNEETDRGNFLRTRTKYGLGDNNPGMVYPMEYQVYGFSSDNRLLLYNEDYGWFLGEAKSWVEIIEQLHENMRLMLEYVKNVTGE